MCDGPDCPPPLKRLFPWLAPFLDEAERIRAEAKREVARMTRDVERIFAPMLRAEEKIRRAYDRREQLYSKDPPVRRKIDEIEEKIHELKDRAYEIQDAAGEKLERFDVHGLLATLEKAYGLSLPPGYSVELGVDGLSVVDVTGTKHLIEQGSFASADRLALEMGYAVEVEPSHASSYRPGLIGQQLDRIERLDYELRNAKRFGLSEDRIREDDYQRRMAYDELPDEYQRRVDLGEYDLESDESSAAP